MKLYMHLKVLVPIKSLSLITIPISAIINQKIDIKIVGSCKCSVKDGVADISIDAKLTAANALVPDMMLNLGKGALKELIINKIVKPLKKKELLLESECKIDDELITL